ncbi:LysR substrate-binding domain-containing protein [Rhizobium sp. J15]|uniref:LysR family transcriptional regulator n=1 Tax=Rhizobium sp. J15 TaxID=2035450 RepID=UPI001596DCFC|nr:LysR substrate-binding domain-containing protein [Rhizobium sp. J15]
MNDRQLRYFIAVAEHLNFSRAAEYLNISQPPLSLQIKALEDELGIVLLKRTRRSVELTDAGVLFLDHARKAMSHMDDAAEVIRQAVNGQAGVLRIAFTGSVPMLDIFSTLIKRFRRDYPNVRLEFRNLSSANQFEALEDGKIDLGILRPHYRFTGRMGADVQELWRDRLMVFMPEDHPLAAPGQPIDMQDLASHQFVAVSRKVGCSVQDLIRNLSAAAGFEPKVVQEGHELSTVLGLVSAGIGVAIMPECYSRIGTPYVVSRPINSPDANSCFMLAMRSGEQSRVVNRFWDTAKAVLDDRIHVVKAA